jgi:hypothetical protein
MSDNGRGRNLTQFERNKYFYGKLMTVRDFETEQSYFNEKRHLLNRLIHGIGIVCGLEPRDPGLDNEKLKIKFTPGVAVDCFGREIVVGKELEVERTVVEGTYGTYYIYLKYEECEKETVPVPANVSSCEEGCCNNRVEEVFEVVVSQDSPIGAPDTEVSSEVEEELEKKKFARDYFKQNLTDCPSCEDPMVLLAVVNVTEVGGIKNVEIDENATLKYRALVYNNPMLYELISNHSIRTNNPHKVTAAQIDIQDNLKDQIVNQINAGTGIIDEEIIDPEITRDSELNAHTNDKDNPHEVSAKQVRALKSVNNVGNVDEEKEYVNNINLESEDDTIGIEPRPSDNKIDLKLNGIAEEKIKFDTKVGHNHDGINSRRIECYESNLAHVESINWEHNGDTPINEIGSNETNFIRLEVTFDKDMLSETINEHTFLVMMRKDEADYFYYHYDYLRADRIDVDAREAKFTISGADRFIGHEIKVVLKSDFILDKNEKALDGNFIGGELPSGKGHQGGDFESWFNLTHAAGDTACISGRLFRKLEGENLEPYPNAPIKVCAFGTEEVIAKDSSDKSGNYCIDGMPTSSTVDIIVEEQLIDSKYRCNRAEMTKIDTGTTPGSCSGEKCIEVEDIIAGCSPITARTCIKGEVVTRWLYQPDEALPDASIKVYASGTEKLIAEGSSDEEGNYCIDNIPTSSNVDIKAQEGGYEGERTGIDTGTTPGDCSAENCVKIRIVTYY